ncbi:MAG: tRNA lysidine(34) synthetase TilS, partial [Candidatus Gastranaerophilales bacterium]|nr:tRNA lysidine(34) synthetase TilS [Candidatus Gastranaerophilales bacterium]
MINKVLEFINKYNLSAGTIIVGFSGGYDSICLLDIMRKIAPENNIRLVAAHYNHNWRGEAARSEQQNCENFCKKYDIEFYTETAPDNIKKTETEARELRYAFFERVLDYYCADVLFTAHNFDDNAETVLYRIIKGTGLEGIRGILPVRDKFYRPLLGIKRADIEDYCRNNGLNPNNDLSNEDIEHKRNLIRHEILPLLSKINPEIKTALNKLSKAANSEMNVVKEYINIIGGKLFVNGKINLEYFSSCSEAVQLRIIYKYLREHKVDYDMKTIREICEVIKNAGIKQTPMKYSLSKDKFLYVNSSNIEIISDCKKNEKIIKINSSGTYNFDGNEFIIEKCNKRQAIGSESIAYVDLSGFDDLSLRTRREGDIISPLGLAARMKLKKYLINKKISEPVRDKLLFLCSGSEVLWAAGVGLSDKIKTRTAPTHK